MREQTNEPVNELTDEKAVGQKQSMNYQKNKCIKWDLVVMLFLMGIFCSEMTGAKARWSWAAVELYIYNASHRHCLLPLKTQY